MATYALIAINVAIWAALFIITKNQDGSPKSNAWGIYSGYLAVDNEYYRIVSNGFLHFGIIHLAFNSFALFNLGSFLEREYGPQRFLGLYFAALVFGSFGAMLLDPNSLTGGASGAVFGLMGAAAVDLHLRGVPFGKSPLVRVIGLNLIITFTIPQISKGGHIGGLIGGALVGWAYAQRRDPDRQWLSWAAPLAVGIVGVIGSVVAAKSAVGV